MLLHWERNFEESLLAFYLQLVFTVKIDEPINQLAFLT